MRQNLSPIDEHFILNNNVFTKNGAAFKSNPTTDDTSPTNDARADPRMRPDDGACELSNDVGKVFEFISKFLPFKTVQRLMQTPEK